MIIVLAGAVEFTPVEIALILTVVALFLASQVCVVAGEVLLPFTLRPRTAGWALGFIPLVGPHMIVHHWRMGAAWHGGLVGTLVIALLFSVAPPQLDGPMLAVVAVMVHFAVRLLVAYKQMGRDPGAMGWRWLLTPLAWLALPFVYATTLRAQHRQRQAGSAALADLPPPTGPPVGGPAAPPPGGSPPRPQQGDAGHRPQWPPSGPSGLPPAPPPPPPRGPQG